MKSNKKNDVAIWLSNDLLEVIQSITESKHISTNEWIMETIERAIIARIASENATQSLSQLPRLI